VTTDKPESGEDFDWLEFERNNILETARAYVAKVPCTCAGFENCWRCLFKENIASIEALTTAIQFSEVGLNYGHGHVWERPDGLKARCGGPNLCKTCKQDQLKINGE
jgi:hypothetical protein